MKDPKKEELIKSFLTEMTTQDNRITRHPYYYVIRHPEYRPCEFGGDSGDGRCPSEKTVFIYREGDCAQFDSEEEMRSYLIDDCDMSEEDADHALDYDCEEILLGLIWREDGMFLTESDAEAHLRANYYHYPEGSHTYVKHAWRADKYEEFLRILFDYFDVPLRVPSDSVV